jgi:integrase/recombinase XerD
MLELGYHSMRRGEEICSLRFEDIQMRTNRKMAILLRRSKTYQYGHGKWIGFPGSVAVLIDRWKTAS